MATCLKELKERIHPDSKIEGSIVINLSNLNNLNERFQKGTMRYSDFQIEINQVHERTLLIIQGIEPTDIHPSFLKESEDHFTSVVLSSKIDAIENRLETMEIALQKVTDYYSTVKIKESDLEWWERLDDVWKHNFSQICGVNPSPEDVEFLLETESLTIEPIEFPREEGKRLKIKDLSPLTRFISLKSLNISNSEVKSLEPIRNFQLSYLNIVGAPIKSLRPIINMTSLKTFKWGENEFLTMETIQSLKKSLPKCNL